MKGKLPKIFNLVKMRLKPKDRPGIVFDVITNNTLPDFSKTLREKSNKASIDDDKSIGMIFYSSVWYEFREFGLLVKINDLTTSKDTRGLIRTLPTSASEVRISVFGNDGYLVDSHDYPLDIEANSNLLTKKDKDSTFRKIVFGDFMMVSAYIYDAVEEKQFNMESVDTGMRLKPSAFIRVGDTVRYEAITDIAAHSINSRTYTKPEEPSGIRKKEHDVRGHWRHYPSGAKVWVRAHRRGDPSLGSVTKVITI